MKNQITNWMLVFIITVSVTAQDIPDITPVYNTLRAYDWNYVNLQGVSSDEIFVPTRGGDWGDNGRWRSIQEHTWTPSLIDINGAWEDAYTGIETANGMIDSLDSSSGDPLVIATLIAEVRFLRAFYYWWLIDLFGDVPLVTDAVTDNQTPHQSSRKEVFDFIVAEINEVLPDFGGTTDVGYYRATKGAAYALLATIYLNAESIREQPCGRNVLPLVTL